MKSAQNIDSHLYFKVSFSNYKACWFYLPLPLDSSVGKSHYDPFTKSELFTTGLKQTLPNLIAYLTPTNVYQILMSFFAKHRTLSDCIAEMP